MDGATAHAQAERIDAVLQMIQARAAAADWPLLEVFAREYFALVDLDVLLNRMLDDLYGMVLSQWQELRQRNPGRARVRVLSPTLSEHGWTTRHTVVEIVNDDMPFLVDSVSMEVNRQALTLHLIIHPVLAIERDAAGLLSALRPRAQAHGAALESVMHLEVDRIVEPAARTALAAGILRVLGDVRAAVADWPQMADQLQAVRAELAAQFTPAAQATLAAEEVDESAAFLEWLANDHFVLLGYRCHDLIDDGRGGVADALALRLVPGSGLGILREVADPVVDPAGGPAVDPAGGTAAAPDTGAGPGNSGSFAVLPPAARALARASSPLLVLTKANSRATVHRASYLDYIGVKRLAADGRVRGEHRFLGLYTSSSYSARLAEVPLLRGKVAAVTVRAGFAADSHLGKALHHILETYPRDELIQSSVDELYDTALGILQLGARQDFRLFLRRDRFDRFITCLIYVRRDSYSTELRRRFIDILIAAFAGQGAEFDVLLTDALLARVQITVHTTPNALPAYDHAELQQRLALAARRWEDDLRDALIAEEGEARGLALFRRWSGAFPAAYRERTGGRGAVADVRRIDALSAAEPLALSLYRPLEGGPDRFGFKLCHRGAPVVLSESLPMLEHLGVRVLAENPYRIVPANDLPGGSAAASPALAPVWIHDFDLQAAAAGEIDGDAIAGLFEGVFARVFDGRVENDDFNRLALRAGLAADDIVIVRAYAKYMRQAGFGLPLSFVEATFAAHPRITRICINLFKLRLDPGAPDGTVPDGVPPPGKPVPAERAEQVALQVAAIEAALDKVTSLNEDRVLRQLLALVMATLRTNYWRTDASGRRRSFLSFKFDPAQVPGLPLPRPMFEIFVYSPRFEGVHLRGGRVARGGLRWSDRTEDFRTEILGLVKAQIVKNTVIVPTGSKGGFVLKKAPPASDRDAYLKEGVACYQDYLRGLLDLTDNLVGGRIVPPPRVVRHDGDDPYLVVAADKGTATFSDYANAISREYGFWLDDAFASGGSAGYDHKAMGITARGAWESVKRHFGELGLDTQASEFTVVGIGDMSGDVFGNGMLLSPHIRLLAAFDHRHLFIDPQPDAAASYAERQRLYALPRSSWADYDAALISAGGGVWPRSVKSVPISPMARAALGIAAERLAPAELISALLKAPVDLLYNGGIGTYVKASTESHAAAGDRANDGLRVDGRELRCRVVAEGGNLGVTQLGRIEYAQSGGRINTDAIDNSAGVDTSDHEVNLKIFLGLAVADGELTERQRNQLLAEMTGDVAALVLRDNAEQTRILSLMRRLGARLLAQQARFVHFLEREVRPERRLDRALEFLPADDEIAARAARQGALSSPELAVLLAYAKIWLADELIGSDLPEDPWIGSALAHYFPPLVRDRFGALMPRHPLRREIIVTEVVNRVVNRVGITFVHRLGEITGAAPAQVVRAYLLAREIFGQSATWQSIEELGRAVADEIQAEMLTELGRLALRATTWFLRWRRLGDPMAATIARFAPAVEALAAILPPQQHDGGADEVQLERWTDAGVPLPLATRVAESAALYSALDIADVAESSARPLADVATVHLALARRLGLQRLRVRIAGLPATDFWQERARTALADDLADLQRALVADALRVAARPAAEPVSAPGDARHAPPAPLAAWEAATHEALVRADRLLAELVEARQPDLAQLSVALRELRRLV